MSEVLYVFTSAIYAVENRLYEHVSCNHGVTWHLSDRERERDSPHNAGLIALCVVSARFLGGSSEGVRCCSSVWSTEALSALICMSSSETTLRVHT